MQVVALLSCSFSPNGTHIVAGGDDGFVYTWYWQAKDSGDSGSGSRNAVGVHISGGSGGNGGGSGARSAAGSGGGRSGAVAAPAAVGERAAAAAGPSAAGAGPETAAARRAVVDSKAATARGAAMGPEEARGAGQAGVQADCIPDRPGAPLGAIDGVALRGCPCGEAVTDAPARAATDAAADASVEQSEPMDASEGHAAPSAQCRHPAPATDAAAPPRSLQTSAATPAAAAAAATAATAAAAASAPPPATPLTASTAATTHGAAATMPSVVPSVPSVAAARNHARLAACLSHLPHRQWPRPREVARLAGHRADISTLALSPCGRLLATACRGGVLKVGRGPVGAGAQGLCVSLQNSDSNSKSHV